MKRHLGGADDGEPPVNLVPVGQQPARLHRHSGEALHRKALAADVGGARERRLGIAARRRQRDDVVRAGRLEQQSVALARPLAIRHGGQRLDVDLDRFKRVFGSGGTVGHHDGERLADIAHLAAGDHRLLVRRELRQQLLPHRDDRNIDDVGRRNNGCDTWARACGADIDLTDTAMRDLAAQDDSVQNISGRDVVDELPSATQKAKVFEPLDWTSDQGVGASAHERLSAPRAHITMARFR